MKRSLSWTIGIDLEIDSIDDLDGEKAKQIRRRYGLQQFWHHQQISKQSCWLRTILEKFAADGHSVENKGFFCISDFYVKSILTDILYGKFLLLTKISWKKRFY